MDFALTAISSAVVFRGACIQIDEEPEFGIRNLEFGIRNLE
jgi:hypothetical protein